MLGFLVGWGVFWLLVWTGVFLVGAAGRADGKSTDADWTAMALGFYGGALSMIWLVAVAIGAAVS